MNSKEFLLIGGIALIIVGVLGFIGVIGPTPQQSIFGAAWWFDLGENTAHVVLGVTGVAAWYFFPALWQKYLVIALGVLGIGVGLYSGVISAALLGSNLENPADTILHLVLGAWALAAALASDKLAALTKRK